ncbi:MAG: hypothetical protein KDD04_11475 [Sinomicrobium sp.]|nr:hypothetical protein [Sinomicrobium sp.]
MSTLTQLSKQIQDGTLPLSQLEALAVRHIREFPKTERMKIFDLLSRFFMARQFTGELRFSFRWLLDAETQYDAVIDPELDALKEIGIE